MAVEIETYEVLEVAGATGEIECDSEAIALIEKLGLEGQQSLISKTSDDEEIRNPYRKMTAEEKWVYEKFLPNKCKLQEYKRDAIPLRVLQIAAHATELNCYEYLQVWYPKDYVDPLLVGCIKLQYGHDLHMLARWGESLKPFEEIKENAGNIFRSQYKAKIKELQKLFEGGLASINELTVDAIIDKGMSLPSGWL